MNHHPKTSQFFLSIVLLCGVGTALSESFGKTSNGNDSEVPEFVQNHLKLSAMNYSSYKNRKLNKAGGNFVSMGNDPSCTFDINIASIQQVIDNGATEIRLAENATYNENVFVSDKNIAIRGGFADCADANNDIQQATRTLITGTGTDPVIKISGSNNTYTIDFQNLDIRNGLGSDFFPGGGISTLGLDANITLENVNVSNNTGNLGGGIAINGGETSLTLIDTVVQFNQAVSGGGIYCSSADALLSVFGTSGILENTATGEGSGLANGEGGGGLKITNGCTASIYSGSSTLTNQVGISGNASESDGGGVLVSEGGRLNLYGQQYCLFDDCFGDSSQPVNVSNNQVRDHSVYEYYGNGGGIYVVGAESKVYIKGVLINDNVADIKGGGLYAITSEVNIVNTNQPCWDKLKCNFFQGNEASNPLNDDTHGGAIYLFDSVTDIDNTVFEDNRADYGTAISLRRGITNMSGSVISNNGNSGQGMLADQYVISMQDAAELTLEHVTMADNKVQNASIGRSIEDPITVSIYSSIIYNQNTGPVFDAVAGITADIDCVIAHEIGSMQNFAGVQLLNNDPKFVAPLERDYHINAMLSPAVDFCAQSNVLGDVKDMDGQARGWDDESVANDQNNPNFIFDAGADETYDNDIIFKNGFEGS